MVRFGIALVLVLVGAALRPGIAATFSEDILGDFQGQGQPIRLEAAGSYQILGSQYLDTRPGGGRDSDLVNFAVAAPLRVVGLDIDILDGVQPDPNYKIFYILTGQDNSGVNTLRRVQFNVESGEKILDDLTQSPPFPQEQFTILSFVLRTPNAARGLVQWDYQISVNVEEIAQVPLPATAPFLAICLVLLGFRSRTISTKRSSQRRLPTQPMPFLIGKNTSAGGSKRPSPTHWALKLA
ncbi:MAG: hypothetical protein AAFQ66_09120 [Pseudomonadota bacterium]